MANINRVTVGTPGSATSQGIHQLSTQDLSDSISYDRMGVGISGSTAGTSPDAPAWR